ncbi:LacI family transcriptional regulator [Brevibacillus fluminis]|uniref:LacI family transcriptional regulator n=1 Tax=Brevibacillus fluminis TaxID=511487 RepID=A0A3M8DSK9_9BACL|nr:LacI family DNA-binding transcriptional regulator [Brevibacillus fluminis]RNB89957.1 LacI family transcriptional regulator [Brevibacillus fluminis]
MVTIKDVAKLAGVAVSTASNALNGKYGVKPETQRRVMEAARQLNYFPSPIAKGLVTNSTRNVSIVVCGPSSSDLIANPVTFDVMTAIATELGGRGYHAMLSIVRVEEEEETISRIIQSRSADALILIGTQRSDADLSRLLETSTIPSLVVTRGITTDHTLAVSVDNHLCGYMATRYLLEMGHIRIGFVGATPGLGMAEERLNGYRDALAEAGIAFDESLAVEGDYDQQSGLNGVRQLLRQSPRRPTAIFAANDLMALGAMEALRQEGLRIPEDVSLIGCDNIPNLHLLRVPLTTIAIPFGEIGRLAAKKIIGTLEGTDRLPDKSVLVPELRIRESVKRLE